MNCNLCGSTMVLKPDLPSVEVRACVCCGWKIIKESWVVDLEDEEYSIPGQREQRQFIDPVVELM
jgi:hypothetical protein